MKTRQVIIVLLIVSLKAFSQDPSYYILGGDKLANKLIYSIEQDDNAKIWLSTNDGVYSFDGSNFEKFDNELSKKSSYFGLVKDRKGSIYCCNLAGQIFKIDNHLNLFYTIPDSLLSAMVNFNFDDHNRLVFRTDNYYVLNPTPKLLLTTTGFSQQIPKNDNGALILLGNKRNEIYYWNNDLLKKEQIDGLPESFANSKDIFKPSSSSSFEFLSKNRKSQISYREDKKEWIEFNLNDVVNIEENGFDFYALSDSSLWFVNDKNGAYVFSIDGAPVFGKKKILNRYRISCFLEDREKNLWLPTFGKGVLIIPNKNNIDFRNHPLLSQDDLTTLSATSGQNILTSGQNGLVYLISDQEVKPIHFHPSKVELLKYFKTENAFFVNSRYVSLETNKVIKDFKRSLKDIDIVNSNTFIANTLDGVTVWNIDSNNRNKFHKYPGALTDNDGNTYFPVIRPTCIKYMNEGIIWVGSSTSGLTSISSKGTYSIKYNGQNIYPTAIELIGTKAYVATTNFGVLVFEDGKIIDSFNQYNSALSNNVSKMAIDENKILVLTDQGIRLINLKTKTISKIGIEDGLLSNFPLNIEIIGDELWFVFFQGVQKLNANSLKKNTTPPVLVLDGVLCNDVNVLNTTKTEFNSDENEFDFNFKAIAFSHRGSLKYYYRLVGLSNEWIEQDYSVTNANYKINEAGDYTFEIYAINESGTRSEVEKYRFTILPPYWKTTWFLIVVILGVALIVFGLFLIRLRISRRRIELEKQLKYSEVTAIKAQMNPHFVFNALNSIQELIVLENARTSISYLGKFSLLMRKFLNHSEKNEIRLSEEIELLQLYLELEQLRFGDEFEYLVEIDESLKKSGEVKLPGMIIQPFVENAIKHGLLHSKKAKKLQIVFVKTDNHLVCTVEDNGIGFKNSQKINDEDPAKHQSFASGATNKRIDLLNQLSAKKIMLKIENASEDLNHPGTIVTIKFPS